MSVSLHCSCVGGVVVVEVSTHLWPKHRGPQGFVSGAGGLEEERAWQGAGASSPVLQHDFRGLTGAEFRPPCQIRRPHFRLEGGRSNASNPQGNMATKSWRKLSRACFGPPHTHTAWPLRAQGNDPDVSDPAGAPCRSTPCRSTPCQFPLGPAHPRQVEAADGDPCISLNLWRRGVGCLCGPSESVPSSCRPGPHALLLAPSLAQEPSGVISVDGMCCQLSFRIHVALLGRQGSIEPRHEHGGRRWVLVLGLPGFWG